MTTFWHDGPADPAPFGCVLTPFLTTVARQPDAPAVLTPGGATWSRADLASHAAGVARLLRAHGVRRGDRVGMAVTRTPWLLAATLGVWGAGAVLVPLEVTAPDRIRRVLASATPALVLVDPATPAEPGWVDVTTAGRAGTEELAGGHETAYVLHTSGSTGEPKGVVVAHEALAHFAWAFGRHTDLRDGDVVLGFASATFDVYMEDIAVAVAHGAVLALADEATRADAGLLQDFCRRARVTWGSVPVAVAPLLDPEALPDWRLIIVGAEAPSPALVGRWTAGSYPRRFLNAYGPTEATVCVTAYDAQGHWSQPLPIGFPLPNHGLAVVDDDGRACGVGVPGELVISGAGLADGYLNRPQETAAAFVQLAGRRAYRTGDLASWREDGALQFLGRRDRQVKVHGVRVELGEVEAALTACPGVTAARAVHDADAGRLLAFWVGEADDDAVDAMVRERLVPAMRPTVVTRVESLPLRSSGKVDDGALLSTLGAPQTPARATSMPAGLPPSASQVATAWCETLGLVEPEWGLPFHAAGGDSVRAMMLVARLSQETGRRIGVADLYRARSLSDFVRAVDAAPAADVVASPDESRPALTAAQRRVWFAMLSDPGRATDHLQVAFRVAARVDVRVLRDALRAVARRHDVLGWRVDAEGNVSAGGDVEVREAPLVDVDAQLAEVAATPFAFGGPLWRTDVWHGGEEDVVAMTFSHLVADGVSLSIIVSDLSAAWAGHLPAGVGASFVRWAARSRAAAAARSEGDRQWWRDRLAGAPAALSIPHQEPSGPAWRGTATVAGATAARLHQHSSGGRTVVHLLGAAWAQALALVCQQSEVVLGCTVSDRGAPEAAGVVGMLLEIWPLRLGATAGPDAAAAAFGDRLAEALSHPGRSLEEIAADTVARIPGRPRLVQATFNAYHHATPALALGDTDVVPLPVPPSPPGFEATLYVTHLEEHRIELELVCRADVDPRWAEQALETTLDLVRRAAAGQSWPVPAPAPDAPGSGSGAGHGAHGRAVGRLQAAVAPANDLERLVVETWSEVLEQPVTSVADNFFDIGGHSLAMTQVAARLRARTGLAVDLVDLFGHPTPRDVARHLASLGDASHATVAVTPTGASRGEARRQAAAQRKASRSAHHPRRTP